MFLIEFLKKLILKKISRRKQKHENLPSVQELTVMFGRQNGQSNIERQLKHSRKQESDEEMGLTVWVGCIYRILTGY